MRRVAVAAFSNNFEWWTALKTTFQTEDGELISYKGELHRQHLFKSREKVIICLIKENDRIRTRQDALINIQKKPRYFTNQLEGLLLAKSLTTDKTKDGSSIEHHPSHLPTTSVRYMLCPIYSQNIDREHNPAITFFTTT